MSPILIGGAPCAGKTTLAITIAKAKNWPCVSVDDLRSEFQRDPANSVEHNPWLFSNATITAEDYWKDHQPQETIELEQQQARELWPLLKDRIQKNQHEILEGVSLMPELVWKEFQNNIQIVFLIDPSRERVWKTISERGLWGEANTYADWIKPKELEWVMLHNDWLREQLKRYPYPLIEIGDDRALATKEVFKVLGVKMAADSLV